MDPQPYLPIKNASFSGIFGVAQTDITPPAGIYSRNWGASEHDVAEGVHRPLILTCLTIQSSPNEKPLVIVAADLGWWKSAEDERFVRGKILNALSLDAGRLMFCLSHTHAGPSLCRDDAARTGGDLIAPYLDQVINSTILTVNEALASVKAGVLTWEYGKCNLAKNRDLPQPEKNRFLVGFNAEIPADDTLLVGRVTDNEGKTLATLTNYACHPTTLAWDNRLISPDFIGAMREIVETETQAPSLFLQGASGDLSPAEQYSGDQKLADRYGRQLGYAVLATLESMFRPKSSLTYQCAVESGAPLAVWREEVDAISNVLKVNVIEIEYPLKPMSSLAELEAEWAKCEDRVLKERLWRKRCIRKVVGDGTTAVMPVWMWQLGDSILVGQCNEAYSGFQINVRAAFPSHAVAVMNVVNGSIGYLPPAELYEEDMYAVWQTPFDKGSLEMLHEAVISQAQLMISEK
ncbi:neutral/alkaline non-lysosomal ceramidase N-terminal domain-containing protein [Dyadobacter sp. CY343]|uniref:neutral/alkaline non-lysosomal ceramidase N-terminal domain-containing protein n=1 Tax=Dyadobacter sp. CY343 TaxID=2907299 RepID=UPI001F320D7F|nr:neutral/alkaline non-lysosomal ceramidase N-terminal domain-containing protein [Dyadobacter sp. CY343]MCE7062190.1 neutral/alkaline non-lysosomal ceramidase N-terminal domain-containing protein [Dyadobacter sp. CY343]